MKIVILLPVVCLSGSIPSGIWIGKLFLKKDIRQFGSGNTGTTSTLRVLGKPTGITVLLMNILKGTLVTSLPYLFGLQGVNPFSSGVTTVLGYTFPIFANFEDGKTVATSADMLLAYSPIFFIYPALIFVIYLYLTSMVSLTGAISTVLITLSTIILPFVAPAILPIFSWLLTVITIALTTFILIRHRESTQRIEDGAESRLSFGLRVKK